MSSNDKNFNNLITSDLKELILMIIDYHKGTFTINDISINFAFFLKSSNNRSSFNDIINELEQSGYITNNGNGIYIKSNIKAKNVESDFIEDEPSSKEQPLNEFEDFFDFDELSESESFHKYFSETEEVIDFKYNNDYFDLLQKDRVRATNNLVKANSKLVWKIVKRYEYAETISYTKTDMFIEGELGLMKAINRFDPSRGFRFSTYATWWVRQAITRGIPNQSLTIRIPVHMYITLNKLRKIENELEKKTGHQPTKYEISNEMNISLEKLEYYKTIYKQYLTNLPSLDKSVDEENNTVLEEFLQENNQSIEELVETNDLKVQINKMLNCVSFREKNIIKMRYGIGYEHAHTLEEIGQVFDVTRERIRQIESKVLKQIRTTNLRKYIEDWHS